MKIVESLAGNWFYHYSKSGKNCEPALCGNKNVMMTSLPLSSWGTKSHLNERYCKECEKIFMENDGKISNS